MAYPSNTIKFLALQNLKSASTVTGDNLYYFCGKASGAASTLDYEEQPFITRINALSERIIKRKRSDFRVLP